MTGECLHLLSEDLGRDGKLRGVDIEATDAVVYDRLVPFPKTSYSAAEGGQ